jgi:hypothetical protein
MVQYAKYIHKFLLDTVAFKMKNCEWNLYGTCINVSVVYIELYQNLSKLRRHM